MLERVISDPESRELLGQTGESIDLEDSIRADMKTLYCPVSMVKVQMLLAGRQGLPSGKK